MQGLLLGHLCRSSLAQWHFLVIPMQKKPMNLSLLPFGSGFLFCGMQCFKKKWKTFLTAKPEVKASH